LFIFEHFCVWIGLSGEEVEWEQEEADILFLERNRSYVCSPKQHCHCELSPHLTPFTLCYSINSKDWIG